ncbi:MAG: nitroreductase family protein [Gammaproteobacteria bacterium]|nr:nitroreductase family protein [Gammaproteobacteria bacterium]MCZ6911721.1 nitroreductase family protein [Pseudomonadota bacterium]
MKDASFLPLSTYREYPPEEMLERAKEFADDLQRRRTVRDFADRSLPPGLIEHCLKAALSAPSGANMQPWHFVVVHDPEIKHRIRVAAEVEEKEFYSHRASAEWLEALRPLGTNEHKPFIQAAPCLIAVFVQKYGLLPDGRKFKHYYPTESVGLATGMLISALHRAGLASLTHTPSPMKFLNTILGRPKHERPFLLIVAGYPSDDAQVPNIQRRALEDSVSYF